MNHESSRAARILVVEDEAAVQQMMVDYLEENGLSAVASSDLEETANHFETSAPDLVILDLQLGKQDGLDLLREIRSHSDVPVIIVTGRRCDEIDRVVGLELGADDYLNKPFSLKELLARIRAIMRRRDVGAPPQQDQERRHYHFDGWRLDHRARRLTDPNGVPVALTNSEYTLLIAFVDAPQRVLSREQLLQATRMHEDIFDRSIDVQVLRLRRKLEDDASAPRLIRTERGVGYMFAASVARL
ncbi:two component transcriptional regulator, winged helix family [Methylocella silvestris BL2]|uniref:Regulatory protein VirG n=1 Tax=Methylocella silvestris (strain DSM 15510 / CIP 108128 / LMG 27833 / NCIMB 13906 / BL2) TaxID=395965 RepID=B8EMV7_METSB|nr:response regulator [Methylocella silvestris]ACK52786.1 two component transcriptional regulator, winged helix family [Methylocella silvestris BL2]